MILAHTADFNLESTFNIISGNHNSFDITDLSRFMSLNGMALNESHL